MTAPDDFAPYEPAALPAVVVRYLGAQADPAERERLAVVFASDARVVDDNVIYEGVDAIHGWLTTVASEYTYTTTFIGQQRPDADRWAVLVRLEGNFAGGVVDLRYRFVVAGDLIQDLVIAP